MAVDWPLDGAALDTSGVKFYLGIHRADWLTKSPVPVFITNRQLSKSRSLPRAVTPWALDSGGFTELKDFHRWTTTPAEYVKCVRRYAEEIGGMDFAAPQDWMCEPEMVAKTGLSVKEHQRRTTENFLELRALAPDLPFIPVIQGYEFGDYLEHVAEYEAAGVHLASEPRVGIGSVCRRQASKEIDSLVDMLRSYDLRLHAFGVKTLGIESYGGLLSSADSLAWSETAKHRDAMEGHPHQSCQNCFEFALKWRERVVNKLAHPQQRLTARLVTPQETLMVYPEGDSRRAYVPGALAPLPEAKRNFPKARKSPRALQEAFLGSLPAAPGAKKSQRVWPVYSASSGEFLGEVAQVGGGYLAHRANRGPRTLIPSESVEEAAASAGWGLAPSEHRHSWTEVTEEEKDSDRFVIAYVGYAGGDVRFALYDTQLDTISARVFRSPSDAMAAAANGVDVWEGRGVDRRRDEKVVCYVEYAGGFWFDTRANGLVVTSDRYAGDIDLPGDAPEPPFVEQARTRAADLALSLF